MKADRHQRVKKLFQQALDEPPAEREAFLRKTCGNDQDTLAEVRSLLAYHSPKTISPTHTIDLAAVLEDAPPKKSTVLDILAPQFWRPTNPHRVRVSFIALLLAALLAALGYWLDRQVESVLRANLQNQLKATLDSNVAAVANWLRLLQHEVAEWTNHRQFLSDFAALLAEVKEPGAPIEELRKLPSFTAMNDLLTPLLDNGVRAVHVTNSQGKILATTRSELIERFQLTPLGSRLIAPVFLGHRIVLPPMLGSTLVENKIPGVSNVPVILVGCPIFDAEKVIGGLFATVESDQEFTRLLDLATPAKGYDTYAFGPQGQLLSASQYEAQLHSMGMIDSAERGASVLKVEIRDPGGDLTAGYKSKLPLSGRPLTRMAASATANGDGFDLNGYRDYRGVQVVGAWTWLKPYGFGVATEIAYSDAYAALTYVRRALWSLFGVTVLFAGVAFASSLSVFHLRREVGAARRLGQYTLESLIGEGGMGKVYKARHALLHRPTAVKVLDGVRSGASAVARFKREVQVASSLTHPNTVEIYDYGNTEDGIFYFAMEYLPGITLDELVERDGPVSTPRVLYILQQVLGSIAEAHSLGLIHRDIKPGNVILCRRGGIADFAKVVDFGLAKDLTYDKAPEITQAGVISGTPLYIAPECLDDPSIASVRSDIYAIGAVAFYLLTGRDLYVGHSLMEVLRQVIHEQPPRVSDLVPTGVPLELVELVHRCVARNPADRPRSIDEIREVVDSLAAAHPWTQADARHWWQDYERSAANHSTPTAAKLQ